MVLKKTLIKYTINIIYIHYVYYVYNNIIYMASNNGCLCTVALRTLSGRNQTSSILKLKNILQLIRIMTVTIIENTI